VGSGIGTGRGGGTTAWDEPPGTTAVSRKVAAKARFKGRAIGQRYLDGAVLSDRSAAEFAEAARAAEIDATDALNKDRIPRAYRKAVKRYFDRLGDAVTPAGGGKPTDNEKKPAADDGMQESGGQAGGDPDKAKGGPRNE